MKFFVFAILLVGQMAYAQYPELPVPGVPSTGPRDAAYLYCMDWRKNRIGYGDLHNIKFTGPESQYAVIAFGMLPKNTAQQRFAEYKTGADPVSVYQPPSADIIAYMACPSNPSVKCAGLVVMTQDYKKATAELRSLTGVTLGLFECTLSSKPVYAPGQYGWTAP